jgi:hypothetical protein
MSPIITGLRLMTTTNPMSVNILVIVMAQALLSVVAMTIRTDGPG